MKNWFVWALATTMGVQGFAQEVDQKKGVFEKVIVRPTQKKGGLMPVYAVGANDMASQWKSDGFFVQGESLVTGKYGSNSNLEIVSPEIVLPATYKDGRVYLHLNEKFHTESGHDYVRVSVSDNGGKNYENLCKRSGDSDEYDEYVDVTKFAGKSITVKLSLTSDESYEGEGWTINQFDVLKTVAPRAAAGLPSNIDLSSTVGTLTYLGFSQVGYSKTLNLYFSAHSQNGVFVDGLAKDKLQVKVDGSEVSSSCLKLQRLSDYNNLPVQIGFLMDVSGSMQDDIDGVARNIQELVEKIGRKMNASAGIYRFGYDNFYSCPKDFKKEFDSQFLIPLKRQEDRAKFLLKWTEMKAGGSYEPYYSCLYDMIDKQDEYWKGKGQKVIILIGDETALYDGNSKDCSRNVTYKLSDKETLIEKLRSNGFQVFTIVNHGLTYKDPVTNDIKQDESFDGIATSTGGVSIDIENNSGYDAIFEKIAQLLSERYVLTIDMDKCSIEPEPNNCPSVEISINGVSTNNVVCPKEQAKVRRTLLTEEYDRKQVPVGSTAEKVGVVISDIPAGQSVQDVIVKVRVHVENGSAEDWTTQTASFEGDGWYASVPPEMLTENAVVEYRFDVVMNGGNYTLSSPDGGDAEYWTITVFPNNPPLFGEPSVSVVQEPCQPINICVDLSDNNTLRLAEIMYRGLNSVDDFMPAELYPNGNGYCGVIPAKFSMAPGFEYYLTAEDELGSRGYKYTSEQPMVYSITDVYKPQSLEVHSTSETVSVTTSIAENCRNFLKGDEVFIYYKNQCDDAYFSLGGYAKVDDPTDVSASVSMASGNSYKDGIEYGDEIVVKLKRGKLLYDITEPSANVFSPIVTVRMPADPVFVLLGKWTPIENGKTSCSTKNNTDFGYVKVPTEYQYVIQNYNGCGAIENIKISIETGNSEVSKHFTVSKNITEVPDYGDGTFAIRYDAEGDEDAVVKIQYGDGKLFQFAITGHEAVDKEECQGITFINPVNQENHVIYINVTTHMRMHVYAIDQDGRLIQSLYDNWVAPNPYHGVDLYPVMQKLTPGQAFFVVVDREGKASCSETIFIDNK